MVKKKDKNHVRCYMTTVDTKWKRKNILDLKMNHPEEFGRFVQALANLENSDDWYRICGIHGNTFAPNDPEVKCPTDEAIVATVSETGEPFYCKHGVYPFIAWHTPYVYQFELLLNKYNTSEHKEYIALPFLDLTQPGDFTFMNDPTITIVHNKQSVIIDNPLACSYYYVDGVKTKTTRNGFLTPTTKREKIQIQKVKKQLNNALYATTYERFSSHPVSFSRTNLVTDYIPLESPHNSLHDIIGGDGGNMSYITISAFDPIFWLHHCNMDRHFYSWLYNNTEHFSRSIHPKKIAHETYESTQAPFFKHDIYDTNPKTYAYGWQNSEKQYMLLKDMLHVEQFPFTYDIIQASPFEPVQSFVELIDVPIPKETVTFVVYIHPKNEELNKDEHFAGSASWFGVNRNIQKCSRCEITRTNIKIDIDEYVRSKGITKENKDEYTFTIEGEGRMLLGSIYTREELIQDGSYVCII